MRLHCLQIVMVIVMVVCGESDGFFVEANQTRVLNSQGLKIIQDLVFVGNVGNAGISKGFQGY